MGDCAAAVMIAGLFIGAAAATATALARSAAAQDIHLHQFERYLRRKAAAQQAAAERLHKELADKVSLLGKAVASIEAISPPRRHCRLRRGVIASDVAVRVSYRSLFVTARVRADRPPPPAALCFVHLHCTSDALELSCRSTHATLLKGSAEEQLCCEAQVIKWRGDNDDSAAAAAEVSIIVTGVAIDTTIDGVRPWECLASAAAAAAAAAAPAVDGAAPRFAIDAFSATVHRATVSLLALGSRTTTMMTAAAAAAPPSFSPLWPRRELGVRWKSLTTTAADQVMPCSLAFDSAACRLSCRAFFAVPTDGR